MKELQFYDAYIDDTYMYFSALDFNGLFRMRLGETKAEFLMHFPGDAVWQKVMHRQVIRVEDCLFFIPYRAHGISVFNLKNYTMDYILMSSKAKVFANYSRVVQCGEGYLLIPDDFKQPFMILDIKRREVCIAEMLDKQRRELVSGFDNVGSAQYGTYVSDNYMYTAVYGLDILLKIDKNSLNAVDYKLGKYSMHNIILFEGKLWFTSKIDNIVYCYDIENGSMQKYDIGGEGERLLFAIVPYRDTLILLPCQGDKIWVFEKESNKWIVLIDLFSGDFCRLIKGVSLFIGYKYVGSELFLFPRGGNGMVKLDSETNQVEIISIQYEDSFNDRREQISIEYSIEQKIAKKKIIVEDRHFGVEAYLLHIAERGY